MRRFESCWLRTTISQPVSYHLAPPTPISSQFHRTWVAAIAMQTGYKLTLLDETPGPIISTIARHQLSSTICNNQSLVSTDEVAEPTPYRRMPPTFDPNTVATAATRQETADVLMSLGHITPMPHPIYLLVVQVHRAKFELDQPLYLL